MKYKLKLNYTEGELKELKELGKAYDSPIHAIGKLLMPETPSRCAVVLSSFLILEHRVAESCKKQEILPSDHTYIGGIPLFREILPPDPTYDGGISVFSADSAVGCVLGSFILQKPVARFREYCRKRYMVPLRTQLIAHLREGNSMKQNRVAFNFAPCTL